MSNPTELPDLDTLEALALKLNAETWETYDGADGVVFGGDGDSVCVCHANAGAMPEFIHPSDRADFIAAANPAAVLALIALARRAQPEGEAPQAEGLTRYSMWSNPVGHGMDPSPSGDWVSFDEVRDLLAAQFQGAQAARVECKAEPGAWSECQLRTIEMYTTLQGPKFAAQQAAAPGALTLLNADELAALHRFQETCQDFDSGGYDVDKNMMKRLASIGVIESKGFNRYQFTEFGDYVVENQAPSAPGTPEAPKGGA